MADIRERAAALQCPPAPKAFKNQAHKRAFQNGWRARDRGELRSSPYGVDDSASLAFRRAWLAGYDLRAES